MGGNLTFNDNDDVQLKGATDLTLIGNLSDSLKINATNGSGASAVNIQDGGNSITVDGSVTVSGTVAATQSGTWNLNNISGTISLPTGASTSALQTTGNTSLSSIDGKLSSLGQKVMGASVPVVIASDQSSLTISGGVNVTNASIPVTQLGNWNIGINSGSNTIGGVTQSSGPWSMNMTQVGGSFISLGQTTTANSVPVTLASNQTAISVTGTVSVGNFPATQNIHITDPSLPVTQLGNWNIGINSGSNTIGGVTQSSGPWTVNMTQVGGASISLGQTTAANSIPVTLASNQTALSVTQGTSPWTIQGDSASGASKAGNPVQIGGVFNTTQPTVTTGQTVETQSTARGALIVSTGVDNFNINNVAGTVSLPTGAATSANQSTEITSLQLIDNPIGPVAAGTAGTNSYLIGGVFNTSLPTLTNGQQAASQFDSSGRQIIAPLTNSSIVKSQLEDNAGNAINSKGNQLLVQDSINVSGQYRAQSVTTSAAEALGAGTILSNRKFISVTPTNGTVYWGFNSSVTTSNGTPIFKNQTVTFSFTDNVHVFLIAGSTTDCRIAEGS